MEISDWQRTALRPGMVHFPTEANRDDHQFCSGCASGVEVRKTGGDTRNRVRCRKMIALLKSQGRKGKPEIIEAGAPGCAHWEKRG